MSDVAIAAPREPYASRPNRLDKLTPKVRRAVDHMVWDAIPFDEAAKQVGLTVQAMRLALAKPHVVRYLKEQTQVLRSSEGPASIHRIKTIRDAAENKPALDAALYFVSEDQDTRRNQQLSASPGITIRVVNVVAAPGDILNQNATNVTPQRLSHDPD